MPGELLIAAGVVIVIVTVWATRSEGSESLLEHVQLIQKFVFFAFIGIVILYFSGQGGLLAVVVVLGAAFLVGLYLGVERPDKTLT